MGMRYEKEQIVGLVQISLTINLIYANDTTLTAESEKRKSLLMKVKEESKKLALNNIQKTKNMTSGPIT